MPRPGRWILGSLLVLASASGAFGQDPEPAGNIPDPEPPAIVPLPEPGGETSAPPPVTRPETKAELPPAPAPVRPAAAEETKPKGMTKPARPAPAEPRVDEKAGEAATAEEPAPGASEAGGDADADSKTEPERASGDFLSRTNILKNANVMLWPLLACSIVALAYVIERVIALRKNRIVPRDFTDRFLDRLRAGKLDRDRALELCRANNSIAAKLLYRVALHWGQPTATIREILAHDYASETHELKRNVRILSATATLAPLLGLLGTVVGMIEAFDSLSSSRGSVGKNEALAHGISLALVATAVGLIVAIVSVVAYYFLLNKVDAHMKRLEESVNQAVDLVAADGIESNVALLDTKR
jgi:biopolymer transport protein ExbB